MHSTTGKARQRKTRFSDNAGGNGTKNKKANESVKDEETNNGGVDRKCAILILIMIFISVFVLSLLWGSRGVFPISLNSVGDSLLNRGKNKPMTMSKEPNENNVKTVREPEKSETFSSSDRSSKKDGKKQPPKPVLDKPTILWWTEALYPHAHRGIAAEITCGEYKCLSTSDKRALSDPLTRGILFYGTDFRAYEAPLPRQPWHEWALLHEESPMNNYALVHSMKLFNHTATFQRRSDYPTTTYCLPNLEYLTSRKPVPIERKNKLRKEKNLAPILYVQSHCDVSSDRDRFVKELMKHIRVDSFGKCQNNVKMPKHLSDPVESMESEEFYDFIAKYKFHLAFENAICDDYITEKFYRPLHVGSVPIYRGSPSARDWAPSMKAFLDVNEFESPEQLAMFIQLIDQHDDIYLSYLTFKERGVTNQKLIDHMNERKYAVNEWNKHSFISGFECHVCEKITERYNAEQAHKTEPSTPLMDRKVANATHLGCPPPDASVGRLEDVPVTDGIHTWVQDYWGMRDQVLALERMIRNGEKDSSKLFEYIEKIHLEHGRHR